MLPDPLRILISAYAIGDLSPRRRAAAVRLLRHSREARALLKALRHNRRMLRTLPRPSLPVYFAAKVVAALPETLPIIQPLPVAPVSRTRTSVAVRWVAAAAVLVVVGVGAYLVGSQPRESAGSTARRTISRPRPRVRTEVAQVPTADVDREVTDPPAQADVPKTTLIEPDDRVPTSPKKRPPAVTKTALRPDPLGTTTPPPPALTVVTPPRLLALPLRDLDSNDGRAKLQKEFGKGETHHIDLFCRDSSRAFDRLQAAVKARGIRLVVDNVAQKSHERKFRAQYLLYCDDLTAAEWSQMLQSLAAADKKPGENVFDHVVVLPFDAVDHTELTAVAGSDLTQPESRRPSAGVAAKKDVKSALVAAIAPFRTPAKSKDVLQFLDGHRDRAAGDIAVVLVLRLPGS